MDLRSERKHSWKVREQQELEIEKYWQASKKRYRYMYTLHKAFSLNRAGGIGPAAPVLARPVFSQGKSKIPFLQKVSNKQSASVIMGLIRLIILSYNR